MKINIDQSNVFFCSDPHYHQNNIVKSISNWRNKEQSCRDFKDLKHHDQTLIDNINKTVGENDILFCLGDWNFGSYVSGDSFSKGIEFRNAINCKYIHLILGNHDQDIRDNKDGIQSIFESVSFYKEILVIEPSSEQGVKAHRQDINLMHYPIRSWNKQRRGSWMLHGHCHGNLPALEVKGKVLKTMDVGFDCHPEFRPFSYLEIKEIMGSRKIFTEDHH